MWPKTVPPQSVQPRQAKMLVTHVVTNLSMIQFLAWMPVHSQYTVEEKQSLQE